MTGFYTTDIVINKTFYDNVETVAACSTKYLLINLHFSPWELDTLTLFSSQSVHSTELKLNFYVACINRPTQRSLLFHLSVSLSHFMCQLAEAGNT